MRILHIADRLSERGGAYTWLLGIVEALSVHHVVRLVVGLHEGGVSPPCPHETCPGLESRTDLAVDLNPYVEGSVPDVVHIHNVVNPAVLEWAAGRPDTLVTVQDHRFFCPTRGKWTLDGEICRRPMARETCVTCFDDQEYFRDVYELTERRLAAIRRLRVTVLSCYMRDELVAVGVPPDRVQVTPPFVYGLDLDAPPDGPPCVLFVGRLAEGKGVLEAVEAWRRSRVALPLVVAGTGPLRAELASELVRSQGPRLDVLGWVDRNRLSHLYRRARALLLPSRWQEPFGLVGLEALAFGVPVVAWSSGGVGDWHPGPGLVPWGDVDGLARALRRAVVQPAEPLTGFEREKTARRLIAIYEQLTEREAKSTPFGAP